MPVVMAAVPPHERPRERLLALGVEALADRELIALVLRNGAPDTSALDLASDIPLPILREVHPKALMHHRHL